MPISISSLALDVATSSKSLLDGLRLTLLRFALAVADRSRSTSTLSRVLRKRLTTDIEDTRPWSTAEIVMFIGVPTIESKRMAGLVPARTRTELKSRVPPMVPV
jgi:hypothetical protein